jgi:PAS domain S-box-containing protein
MVGGQRRILPVVVAGTLVPIDGEVTVEHAPETRDLRVGALLGGLAAVSPDLLCATDGEGVLQIVNPAWSRLLGWEEHDLLGRRLVDLVHEEDRGRTSRAWAGVVAGEPLVDVDARLPTRSGDWRWISWSSSPDVEPDRIVAAGRDIHARMQQLLRVTESESLLAAAERVARIGSWEWRLDGDVAHLSAELRRILAVDDETFSLQRLLDIAHPEDRTRLAAAVQRSAATGDPLDVEYRVVHPDSEVRVVRERGECVVEDDEVVRMFGTVQDVTEQREVEIELRRAAAVEQEAAARLRELDRMKNAFMSAVSHELRTPLTVVQGMAATLQHRRDALPTEVRSEVEDALVEHAARLGHLLEGLLDIDRLSRDALPLNRVEVDVVALTREVLERSSVTDRSTLQAPGRLLARLDRLQFERIVVNLLDNAAKYAPMGQVTVRLAPRPTGGCQLEVADEGPGIPAGELTRVFDAFHRVDEHHPRPGTGIGLALVVEFARLHGGRAWARQSDTTGACIVVELPDGPVGDGA